MNHLLSLQSSLLLATASLLPAHPGKEPYELYCGACHAPDGKGISDGQFPPLAQSEWVAGNPKRIIEIVLHGIQGPLEVAGKSYNLAMPPHKDSLTDDQIAKIISYVRTSWGNQGSEVTPAQIAAMRQETAKQTEMWDAAKLLEKYPLEKPPVIRDLLSYTHHGTFRTLADLRKSEPINFEEESLGLISLKQAALKADQNDNFGMTWTGWLEVPRDGRYTFIFDTDDGGALTINEEEIITRSRVGPAGTPSRKAISLKKGRANLKVEYYELTGEKHLSLAWQGPQLKPQSLADSPVPSEKGGSPSIPLIPPAGEATIYRNFIAGTDPRGIAVGYSERVNLAFGADSMNLDLLWLGDFMDAGRHWTNRGQGDEQPAGENLVTLGRGHPFAILPTPETAWPKSPTLPIRFGGYRLDEKQHPTFFYHHGPLKITDTPIPGTRQLTRHLTIEVPDSSLAKEILYLRLLQGTVAPLPDGGFLFNDELEVTIPKSPRPPLSRQNEVLLPIPLTAGSHSLIIDYTWNQ